MKYFLGAFTVRIHYTIIHTVPAYKKYLRFRHFRWMESSDLDKNGPKQRCFNVSWRTKKPKRGVDVFPRFCPRTLNVAFFNT